MPGLSTAGLMAAGSGSRLAAGGVVTPKPFLHVGGRSLIDYFLGEIFSLGVRRVVAAVRKGDATLIDRLHADHRFDWHMVEVTGTSTFESVSAITDFIGTEEHIIGTCDVIMPPGTIGRLSAAARRPEFKDALLLILSTDCLHDSDPIWLHVDEHDASVVKAIGKKIPASDLVFGSVRWCSAGLRPYMRTMDLTGVSRDTEFLSRIVTTSAGRVRTLVESDVIDVDDVSDIEVAERLIASYRTS